MWSPDGARLALTSVEESTTAVYLLQAGRPNSERLLRRLPNLAAVSAWLPSGRGFLATTLDAESRWDIARLPLEPDAPPVPLVATPANEHSPELSPDARWFAYVSDAGGRDDVYVRRADGQGEVWRVSSEGGQAPSWRRDGRELFYVNAAGRLRAVPTALGASFSAGDAQDLCDVGFDRYYGGRQYDVAPDGRRILLNRGTPPATSPIVVVLGLGRELARATGR